jgi:predicted kinase
VKQLILLVGLPRCGKTTYADYVKFRMGLKGVGVSIVSPDDIRFAIYGKYGSHLERDFETLVWFIAHTCVKAAFVRDDIVILDATNLINSDRDKWLSTSWTCRYVVFPTDKITCIERARRGDREDLVEVIERMDAQQYPPLSDEQRKNILHPGWYHLFPGRRIS